ncbi:hypothetical protein BGZ99_004329 [Dissophora globulifera]|uniref:G-protein coupled receptors family 3 profile domain-containing protein n=1 Tax=Dissophora globulifera TaxID=979702 RepID=A0A9P6V083_9FUNG|nr:hypothetical protein BGZ99_004329 [Dissophora globulifera]
MSLAPAPSAYVPGATQGPGRDVFDPPYHTPGLTDQELNETWWGLPNTLKIGILLPFTPIANFGYRSNISRISLSVLRMAQRDMNEQQVIPVPGIMDYLRAIFEVIIYYGWSKISILHTTDLSGQLAEKAFSAWCNIQKINVLISPIQPPDDPDQFDTVARAAVNIIRNSDTRIHVLIAPRPNQLNLLSVIRDVGLFNPHHVWLTTIDISNSIATLPNPSSFNGLIMADALWNLPGLPAFEQFEKEWVALNTTEYPMAGNPQLTWHETFAYTCMEVIVRGYRDLVLTAMNITDEAVRNATLLEIRQGKRSQELTKAYLAARVDSTPIGNFTITKEGDPRQPRISIMSFQNHTSVPNGAYVNGTLNITNPIRFNNGGTGVPLDSPSWDELKPSISDPFGIVITTLGAILAFMILTTGAVVIWNRENIIVKSASPLFCILELTGLLLTLSFLFFRAEVPSDGACRVGLMVTVLGLTINLSALVVKNYRIYRIFNTVSVINHAVSTQYLVRVISIPIILTLIPCIVHLFINNLEPTLIRTNNGEYWVACRSDSSQVVWGVLIGFVPGVMILFGVYLAFKTRNVTRLWNEARSIALTIYIVTFFVILIIIVTSFDWSLYQITFHVTMVCILVSSFLEYVILFYPKLQNLRLQKRGMHVAAGREADFMENFMGGHGPGPRARLNGDTFMRQLDPGYNEFSRGGNDRVGGLGYDSMYGGGGGGGGRMGVSPTSENDSSLDMQGVPNISDLASSYPFGQLSGEGSSELITSPVHRPTVYGTSSLTNRHRRNNNYNGSRNNTNSSGNLHAIGNGLNSGGNVSGEDDHEMEELDLSDPHTLRADRQSRNTGGGGKSGHGNIRPKIGGYHTFGLPSSMRADPNFQPPEFQQPDLHEILMSEPNRASGRGNVGLLSADGFPGGFRSSHRPSATSLDPEESMFPRFQRQGSGFITRHPLLQSGLNSRRETKMNSYTVTVPVQRHRWYILRLLAQWRMSRIVFVPYSKLLVILDLETEKSSSLILHSIEPGYSHSDSYRPKSPKSNTNTSNIQPKSSGMRESESTVALGQTTNQIATPGLQNPLLCLPLETQHQLPLTGEAGPSKFTLTAGQYLNDAESPPSRHSTAIDHSGVAEGQGPHDQVVEEEAMDPTREDASKGQSPTKSSFGRMNTVKKLSVYLGLDIRNMDGVIESEDQEGIKGIMSDYVVRIISIHNEVWRVQLPDQETMNHWIDLGQQIKDENWITRPIASSGSGNRSSNRSANRSARNSYSAGAGCHRGSVDGPFGFPPFQGRTSVRMGLGRDDDDDMRYDFRPPNRDRESRTHPLQTPVGSHCSVPSTADPMDSTLGPPLPPPLISERMHSDITETSVSMWASESERELSRARAAKINQQMRESSRYAPLRGMIHGGGGIGGKTSRRPSSPSVVDSNSSKTGKPFLRRIPRAGSLSYIHRFPTRLRNSTAGRLETSSQMDTGSNTTDFPFSTAGSTSHNTSSSSGVMPAALGNSDTSNSTQSLTVPPPQIQISSPNGVWGQVSMQDALAETNIAYHDGQHAIYRGTTPDYGQQEFRHSNHLQYNYNRKRNSQGNISVVGSQSGSVDGQSGFGGTLGAGDIIREQDFYNPGSPEWHLTSSDLEKLEADHGTYLKNRSSESGNEDLSIAVANMESKARHDRSLRPSAHLSAEDAELPLQQPQRLLIQQQHLPQISITEPPSDTPNNSLSCPAAIPTAGTLASFEDPTIAESPAENSRSAMRLIPATRDVPMELQEVGRVDSPTLGSFHPVSHQAMHMTPSIFSKISVNDEDECLEGDEERF